METTRKSRSFSSLFTGADVALREVLVTRPKAWLLEAREKMRDLPKTNFDLGCNFAERGKWMDAIFRFRVVLYLQPGYPQAYYNLGCCYFRVGKMVQARDALRRALQQKPDHADAIFMLTAIDPSAVPANLRPSRMPKGMVVPFFAGIAASYDRLEMENQYAGAKLVHDAVKPILPAADITVVDLGCGTGIAARPWRGQAKDITGVDFTAAMEAASASIAVGDRKLYDRVIEADIAALPETLPAGAADLVLLVNVVQFVGELNGVLSGAARLMKQGGLLAMTLEPFNGNGGFGLSAQTGRFGHTATYAKQVASTFGLIVAREARVNLYPGTEAILLVFSKGNQ